MKPLIAAAMFLFCFCGRAQIIQPYQPVTIVSFQNPMTPLLILEHFSRNYADAIPFWGMEGKNYTVRYIDPQTSLGHKLVYDKQGTILRSENEMPLTDCPSSLVEYYQKNHPNETLRIWSYEETQANKKYYFKRYSKIVWFDEEGHYMKKKILWD